MLQRKIERPQTAGEEIANSVSHGLAWLAAAAAIPFLIVATARQGGVTAIVGAAVFSASILVLYLSSTLYHAMPRNRAKDVFQRIDHIAIFLLIAGTYTPFTLGVLRGGWGWTIFGLVWGLCVTGIVMKLVFHVERFPKISVALYLAMGWIAVIASGPLLELMSPAGVAWILAGGVAYTLGVPFFLLQRLRYSHLVWHVCVILGTTCHFVAVARYAA